MSWVCIPTRGIGSWRDRLARPDRQWRRGHSAFEAAVSWELAAKRRPSGLPQPIEEWFIGCGLNGPVLALAIAEHKVKVGGRGGDSQCDVWALVRSEADFISVAVEAKALEPFGSETLEAWLSSGKSERSPANRRRRWESLRAYLPALGSFNGVQFQLLHRCAGAVIEAKRLRLRQAACIIQSFRNCPENISAYERFCRAIDTNWNAGCTIRSSVDGIALLIGWVDCALATDKDVAACV